ncbi:MAG: hypothetical protein AB1384_04905 [Actinomycetota bacterium]
MEETGQTASRGPLAARVPGRGDPWLIALAVLVLLAASFYTFAYFHEKMPYKSTGYDTYSHLGILRSVEDQIGVGEDLVPGLFPDLYRSNNRSGINYVAMALAASVPGNSNFFTLYLFGLLGIAVFLAGAFYLTRTLFGSSRAAFLAALFSLVLCGYDAAVHGNSYTWLELMIDAHYASTLAVGLMMFCLALNAKYLRKGGWKPYLVQVLLAAVVFNIHMLTGIQYFLVLVILVIVYAARERSFSRQHLLLLGIIPAALLLATLWPLYHWWDIFSRGAVGLDGREGKLTGLLPFLEGSVLFLIGLPFLIRKEKERLFLLFWALAFAAVTLSFVTPVSIAYYWRFQYVMRIPLVIGLALGLGLDVWRLRRWKAVAIPVILAICLAFIGVSLWRTGLRYQGLTEKNNYDVMEPFAAFAQEGDVLIANPATSYNLMGISSYNVVSVLAGHAPRQLTADKNQLLEEAFLLPYPSTWQKLLEEYGASEVLVPNVYSCRDTAFLLNGTRLQGNMFYSLYEVDAENLDTGELTATPDPELRGYAAASGFTRFDHWTDFQYSGRRDIVMEGVEDGAGPGDSFLRVTSDDPEGAFLFVNRGFISVDPSRSYTISTTLRETQGEPLTLLAVYQYGSTSPYPPLAIYNIPYGEPSTSWKRRDLVMGPAGAAGVNLTFRPDTRYVKIGLLTCYFSTGQVEVDSIELVPR